MQTCPSDFSVPLLFLIQAIIGYPIDRSVSSLPEQQRFHILLTNETSRVHWHEHDRGQVNLATEELPKP